MALFTKSMLEETVQEAARYEQFQVTKTLSDYEDFHIFLSHSYKDRKYIRKLKDFLEKNFNLKCYVDWITEPKTLDRNNVNRNTAELLRKRMRQSKSLLFCTSDNSPDSKWMPWELGYFDAHKGLVAILPIVDEGKAFQGQEYLSLYPYVDVSSVGNLIWVNESAGQYITLQDWLSGKPIKRS